MVTHMLRDPALIFMIARKAGQVGTRLNLGDTIWHIVYQWV